MESSTISATDVAQMMGKTEKEVVAKYQFHLDPNMWLENFIDFLRTQYLPRCFKKPNTKSAKGLIREMTAEEFVPYWVSLVTHPTYDRNVNGNFERAEHYGDRGQGVFLSYFTYKKYPYFTEDDVTNIQNKFLSKKQQAKWSVEMGIPKFYRGFVEISIDIQEDLFESLFSGILVTGNTINPGLGYILGQNFIFKLFSPIDLNETYKDPKTRYKDTLEIMWWSEGTGFEDPFTIRQVGNSITYTFNLTDTAVREINQSGKKVQKKFITQTANVLDDGKVVKKNMYEQALEKLAKLGYKREDLLENRKQFDRSPEMTQKMEEEGLTSVRIEMHKEKNNSKISYIYQIVAVNKDGDLEVLYSADVDMKMKKISRPDLYKVLEQNFIKDEENRSKNERLMRRQIIRKLIVQ